MVVGEKDDKVFIASEEAAIRTMEPNAENIWVLTNLERVSDHCSNIATCIIEMSERNDMDLHDYSHKLKESGMTFDALYHGYLAKYSIKD